MKVLRVTRSSTRGPIVEIAAELVEKSLNWCVQNQVPWVTPHKNVKEGSVQWLAQSPLPFFRTWFEEPWFEKEQFSSDEGIYGADIPIPVLTADTIMIKMANKTARYLSVNTSEFENLAELEDFASREGKDLYRELHAGRMIVVPSSFVNWITTDINFEQYGHLGFSNHRHGKFRYVEIRFWKNPDRIERLDSCDGHVTVDASLNVMPVLNRSGWTPFPNGVRSIVEEDLNGFYFANPVSDSKAEILIPTPLADMDELFLPRTHARGQITAGQLGSVLTRRLGTKVDGIDGIAKVLAQMCEERDGQLVTALGAPRMVVSGEATKSMTSWVSQGDSAIPKPCELEPVRQLFPELIDAQDERTSEFLLNMVSRACIVIHLRNTTVFDSNYKTSMFDYETIIGSLMRANPHDKAGYLTPMFLIASLDRKRIQNVVRHKPSGGTATSPLIGDTI